MTFHRVSEAAQNDIAEILDRSLNEFGEAAQTRYAVLIAAAMRHAATTADHVGFKHHPEYDDGVMTWHLGLSARRVRGEQVKAPRHILVCRRDGGLLVVGRVLDHAMDPLLHMNPASDWT